jgi:Protein of unknown function (DUF3574)
LPRIYARLYSPPNTIVNRRTETRKHVIAAAIAVVTLASAAQAQQLACPAPEKPMLRAEMYFGRAVSGSSDVSERQWTDFVGQELTPRFPDGLTVLDGEGQWRNPEGAIVREPSKIVIIVIPDADGAYARLEAAAAAYKQRFRQTSVGVVTRPVCAEF